MGIVIKLPNKAETREERIHRALIKVSKLMESLKRVQKGGTNGKNEQMDAEHE